MTGKSELMRRWAEELRAQGIKVVTFPPIRPFQELAQRQMFGRGTRAVPDPIDPVVIDYSDLEHRVMAHMALDIEQNPPVIVIDSLSMLAETACSRLSWYDFDHYDRMKKDEFVKQYMCEFTVPEVDKWHSKNGTQRNPLHADRETFNVQEPSTNREKNDGKTRYREPRDRQGDWRSPAPRTSRKRPFPGTGR